MSASMSPNIRKSWAAKRAALRPKPVGESQADWVKTSFPKSDKTLPLLVEPKMKSVDLFDWIESNRERIKIDLRAYGGILFRGFGLRGEDDFHRALEVTGVPLMHYIEGATPRTKVDKKVYTSTEFPADQSIALHNELNYVKTWPMKIFFYCDIAAAEGGETPIADVRRVFERLDPEIRESFIEKGWMLVRNFGDGLGPTWQTSYRVNTKEELAEYFQGADISYEWKDDEHLRTRQVRPAVARHLETGEIAWFNHVAFWHVSSLSKGLRDLLLREKEVEDLPYSTYYGDGTPIEDSVVAALREAYDEETVAIPWQEGDFLMLDNMLVAHGRKPFKGERRVLTAMGEPCSDRNL